MSSFIKVSDVISIIKHPSAKLDYKIDWETWLDGDTLVTSEWDVPEGVSMEGESNDTLTTTVWISGGIDTLNYSLINRVTTTLGRLENKELIIKVRIAGGI
jgi:hypothetical protein